MKTLKYILSCLILIATFSGCKKEINDDVSFVQTTATSAKLGAMFTITQDNTGLVTITPNGEGVASFEIAYGHGTAGPVKVLPGGSTSKVYPEGVYDVKITGTNLAGVSTTVTQKLTVTFRAPENLEVTAVIDPANKYKVNVSAKALYETFFQVYFGDVTNEVPTNFLEGQTISKTYAKTGSYTVRVVALSGGAATTTFTKVITIVDPVVLPVTFESTSINYAWNDFSGGNVTVVANPHSNAANNSTRVAKMVKNAGDPWGGSWIGLGGPIDFSANKVFRMKVFSPRVGAKVLLKVENAGNGSIAFEKEVLTTVANAWEELTFTITGVDASGVADSLGTMKWIKGIVTSIDFDGNGGYSFYVTDGTDGINIYNFADQSGYTTPMMGDSLFLHGEVDQFNGLTELFVDSIYLANSGNTLPAPTVDCALDGAMCDGDYPEDPIFKIASTKLAAKDGKVFNFFQKFVLTTDDQLSFLGPVDIDKVDPATAASDWIAANEATWSTWFS